LREVRGKLVYFVNGEHPVVKACIYTMRTTAFKQSAFERDLTKKPQNIMLPLENDSFFKDSNKMSLEFLWDCLRF